MAAKYLFFDPNSNNALVMPAEQLLSMDQTDNTSISLRFSDAQGSNGASTEVDLTVSAGTEKAVMKAISESIAFGKDQFLVVADSVNSDYLHADITGVSVTTSGQGLTEGSGIAGTGTLYYSWREHVGDGVIKTQIFADLTGLEAGGGSGDIIGGASGAANSHFGQVTTAICGTIFHGHLDVLEVPAGSSTDIDLYSATEGTGAEDAGLAATLTETLLLNAGTWAVATRLQLTVLPAADQYLYLANIGTEDAAITAGRFLLTLYGTV
jgi:hypothetical protein